MNRNMAGSYNHCIDEKSGNLLSPELMDGMIENLGDAYEAIEEMYWMIHHLTKGNRAMIVKASKAADKLILKHRMY